MGCEVKRLDDGTTVDIHRFDTEEAAQNYLTNARGYRFSERENLGLDGAILFYTGSHRGERASLRSNASEHHWSVAFWKVPTSLLEGIKDMMTRMTDAELQELAREAASIHNGRQVEGDDVVIVELRRVLHDGKIARK